MKRQILRDEAGELFRFKPLSLVERGGIRCFIVRQEKNEWTHPEFYDEIHRSANPNGKWFVHHIEHWAREYVE